MAPPKYATERNVAVSFVDTYTTIYVCSSERQNVKAAHPSLLL